MYFQLDEMIFQSPEPRFPEFASADYYQSLVCLTIGKQSLPIPSSPHSSTYCFLFPLAPRFLKDI